MSDTRLRENVRAEAVSIYHGGDRLVLRRAAYDELAIHQEGDGRSVYLTRAAALRFALRLLREAAHPQSR